MYEDPDTAYSDRTRDRNQAPHPIATVADDDTAEHLPSALVDLYCTGREGATEPPHHSREQIQGPSQAKAKQGHRTTDTQAAAGLQVARLLSVHEDDELEVLVVEEDEEVLQVALSKVIT